MFKEAADAIKKRISKDLFPKVKEHIDKHGSDYITAIVPLILSSVGVGPLISILGNARLHVTSNILKDLDKEGISSEEILKKLKNNEDAMKELYELTFEISKTLNILPLSYSILEEMKGKVEGVKDIVNLKEELDEIRKDWYNESGLNMLIEVELTEEKAEEEFKEWKEGYEFGFAAIYHKKEFRREDIINKIKENLEKHGKCVIEGESGTSKSTLWKEVLCDYLKEGYIVLYNEGREINYYKAKAYLDSIKSNKIIIGVDNAQSKDTAYIYDLIYDYEDIKFIITRREPDYERFFKQTLYELNEGIRKNIISFDSKSPKFAVKLTNLNKSEVEEFFRKYDATPPSNIYEDTNGNPLLVRFFITGKGLKEHVICKHEDFIVRNKERNYKAMLICSILDLGFRPASEELVEQLRIKDAVMRLSRVVLYNSEGLWRPLHHLWTLTWFHYFIIYLVIKMSIYAMKASDT